MTARRSDIADLPGWPRGLRLEHAAAYVGLSVVKFKERVSVSPIILGGVRVWDRLDLDHWFDSQPKSTAPLTTAQWLEQLDDNQDQRDKGSPSP